MPFIWKTIPVCLMEKQRQRYHTVRAYWVMMQLYYILYKRPNLVVSTVKHSGQSTERFCSKAVVKDTVNVHHVKIVRFFMELQKRKWLISMFIKYKCNRAKKEFEESNNLSFSHLCVCCYPFLNCDGGPLHLA